MSWLRWIASLRPAPRVVPSENRSSFPSRAAVWALLALMISGSAALAQSGDISNTLTSTRHSIALREARLDYEATAGTLILRDEGGKARANIFFTAYCCETPKDAPPRPILFLFNGGPGSSSAYLHLGAFGPRRAVVEEDILKAVNPPFRLVDNDATLLDLGDLVFIDPVSTGFSRPAPGQAAQQFHGVQEDAETMAGFIRRYVKQFGREKSPKFVVGESYGAARAAAVTKLLQDEAKITVNGVVLISMVLTFQSLRFNEGNDLPYALFLPTYTTTAWHHQKLIPKLQADFEGTVAEAERFAEGEYTTALMKGSRLSPAERAHVLTKLSRFTGLSEEYLSKNDLRIPASQFREELLRREHRALGRYDSRFLRTDAQAAAEGTYYDPSRNVLFKPLSALIDPYLRNELRQETELGYRVSTDKIHPWNYGSAEDGYVNVAPSLREAMIKNPSLQVFVACGYYDLATPHFAARYTLDHLGLEPRQMRRVIVEHYHAGHMMYIDAASRTKLRKDLERYLRASLEPRKDEAAE
jgi:carboxypeptidase C (cathepsin A)